MSTSIRGMFMLIRVLMRLVAECPPRAPRTAAQVLAQARRIRWAIWGFALSVLLQGLLGTRAEAIVLFDTMVTKMQVAAGTDGNGGGIFGTVINLATNTFEILAVIELCWAAAIWAFEKDNLSSLALEIIKKIMFVGFFYALLLNGQTWIPSIVNSFQQVGDQATGITLSTDGIITQGENMLVTLWSTTLVAAALLQAIPEEVLGNSIPGVDTGYESSMEIVDFTIFVSTVVMVSYAIVAAQFFMVKVESSILLAAGAIFLGLGSTSWTKEYTQKYLNYAVTVGVRLLVLTLILSFTLSAIKAMPITPIFGGPAGVLEILAASFLQAVLAMKAPELASALLGGGIGLSAGSLSSAVMTPMQNYNTMRGMLPVQQGGGQVPGGGLLGKGGGSGGGGGGGGVSSVGAAASAGLGGMSGMGAAGGGQTNRSEAASSLGGLSGRSGGTGDGTGTSQGAGGGGQGTGGGGQGLSAAGQIAADWRGGQMVGPAGTTGATGSTGATGVAGAEGTGAGQGGGAASGLAGGNPAAGGNSTATSEASAEERSSAAGRAIGGGNSSTSSGGSPSAGGGSSAGGGGAAGSNSPTGGGAAAGGNTSTAGGALTGGSSPAGGNPASGGNSSLGSNSAAAGNRSVGGNSTTAGNPPAGSNAGETGS